MNTKISKLAIGTAQFGMDYGISNISGQSSEDEVRKILNLAVKSGINFIDTASQYGTSEEVLGRALAGDNNFHIVTKTPHFKNLYVTQDDAELLKSTFMQSLKYFCQDRIYGLMIHNSQELLAHGGELLWGTMKMLKHNKLVKKIGVSVYNSSQIDAVLERYNIDLIQIPVNILDQRLIKSGHLKKLKQAGVEIHIRSVFLQGLLLIAPDMLNSFFDSVRSNIQAFHKDCSQNQISAIAACLGFVLGLSEVDRVVVGVCSKKELEEIIEAAAQKKELKDYFGYAWHEEKILNPVNWIRR